MWEFNLPDSDPDKSKGRGTSEDPKLKKAVAKDVSTTVPAKRTICPVDDDLLPRSKRLNLLDSPPGSSDDQATVRFPLVSGSSSITPLDLGSLKSEDGDFEMEPSCDSQFDQTEVEEETPRLSRAAKGKSKMRVVPELPAEVWKRIFELYYDQCAGEWQTTGQMKNGTTPLLISPTLTNVATPVLYAHPHISHRQILPFMKSIVCPFRCSDHRHKKELVHHLTVRPTPIIPNYEDVPVQQAIPQIVDPAFPKLMAMFPDLDSFTLKDTFIFGPEDVTTIIDGLKEIRPRKARIELRSWDLYDSPVGPDLIAATRPNIRASIPVPRVAPTSPNPRGPLTVGGVPVGPPAFPAGEDMLRSWRDALHMGRDLFLPLKWLDPTAPGLHPGGAQPLPLPLGAQAPAQPRRQMTNLAPARRLQPAVPPNPTPWGVGGVFPSGTVRPPNQVNGTSAGSRSTSAQATNGSDDEGEDSDETEGQDDDNVDGGSGVPISAPGPSVPTSGHMPENSTSHPPTQTTPFDPDFSRQMRMQGRGLGITATGLLTTESASNTPADGTVHTGSMPIRRSRPDVTDMDNTASDPVANPHLTHRLVDAGNGTDRMVLGQSISATAQSQPIAAPIPPTPTSLAMAARPLRFTNPERYEAYVRGRRADHIYIPPDEGGEDGQPLAGPSSISASSYSDRPTLPLDTASTGPGVRLNAHTRLVRGGSPELAHAMRNRLRDLITQDWAGRLQAFSFVAFDPLASLVVRAPQLDFWINLPIEHIRVHLSRGVNSLAIFKSPQENEGDRIEAVDATTLSIDHDSAVAQAQGHRDPPSPILQDRVVGGDGFGGGLVHPSNLLFEIEVNTVKGMMDDMWIRAGSELPPQVCRILLGDQDWSEVVPGRTKPNTPETHGPEEDYPSPKTDDYPSPTYSFSSTLESDEEVDDLDIDRQEPGEGYDAQAASRQIERLAARKRERGSSQD